MFPPQFRIYLLVAVLVALGVSGAATIYAIVDDTLPQQEDVSPHEERGDSENESQEVPAFRPHLRKEDRDLLREENRQQELIGEEVSRIREGMEEQGIDIDIEKIREEAVGRLEQAAEFHMAPPSFEDQPHDVERMSQAAGACFRSDGSTTNNREECDQDQGQHLGFREEFMHQDSASPAFMEEQMHQRFGGFSPSTKTSPNVLEIIGQALQRLGSKVSLFEDEPETQAQIRDTIRWLSGVLAEYADREPSAEQSIQLADEIQSRLENMVTLMGGPSTQYGHMEQRGAGSMMMGPPPGMAKGILMMMDGMMRKLPMVITLFEENGIPVTDDARRAAEEARALFEQIRPACEADPMACMRLREVGAILETRMRPSMEQAMMASGNMQLGMRIQQMMAEDGMMGPPPMMDRMGPQPGFDSMHMGAPEGFGPPPGFDSMHMGAPEGFGPPQGFDPSQMGDIQSRMMQCMMSGGSKSDCMNQMMGSGFPQ